MGKLWQRNPESLKPFYDRLFGWRIPTHDGGGRNVSVIDLNGGGMRAPSALRTSAPDADLRCIHLQIASHAGD